MKYRSIYEQKKMEQQICTELTKKNWTLCYVIISFTFDKDKLHENCHKYTGGIGHGEYGINVHEFKK